MNPSHKPKQAAPPLPEKPSFFATGFFGFIFKQKDNRLLLISVLSLSILFFILYKYCLPMPDFSADSFSYILAAVKKMDIYYRPLGYSHFLEFLHNFSSSDLFTVAVQYFLLTFSSLFLFFSVDYLYGFKHRWVKYTALVLMTLNPAYLVLCNQILADPPFTAFTICWFGSLLWVQKKASWWGLAAQLLFLYWSFELRYNALFYPAISVLVFVLAYKAKIYYRAIGILASIFVVWSIYNREIAITEKSTATPIFSAFGGWSMANNALLLYKHIDVATSDFEDPEMKILDQFAKHYIDSISTESREDIKEHAVSSVFLWDKASPLKQYLFYHCNRYRVPYFLGWYQVSPMFYDYGKRIIAEHPGAFIQYFVLPNTYYFFWPLKIEMESYLYGKERGAPAETREWFGYKTEKLSARYPGVQAAISSAHIPLHGLVMIAGILLPLWYVLMRRKKKDVPVREYLPLFLLWLFFMGLHLAFCITASMIVLRYQIPLFIISCSLPLWFLDQCLPAGARSLQREGGEH